MYTLQACKVTFSMPLTLCLIANIAENQGDERGGREK